MHNIFMNTVERKEYLDFLWEFKDRTDTAKIICGVRRCGKSTLMQQMIEKLTASGVSVKNIIYIDFELAEWDFIKDQKDLKKYLKENMGNGTTYVFFDEIQRVEDWEIVVNSLS